MKLNMNQQGKVKLTPYGRVRYYWHYYEYNDDILEERMRHLSQNDNVLVVELWKLANIFGSSMHNGCEEVPFENNEIEVVLQ